MLRKHDVITVCSIKYVTTEKGHRSCYLFFFYFCDINGPTLLKYPPEYTAYFLSHPVCTYYLDLDLGPPVPAGTLGDERSPLPAVTSNRLGLLPADIHRL